MAFSLRRIACGGAALLLLAAVSSGSSASLASELQAWSLGPPRTSLRDGRRGGLRAAAAERGASEVMVEGDDQQEELADSSSIGQRLAAFSMAALAGLLVAVSGITSPVSAADKRLVAEIPASGLLFKDTINVEAFEDPKVSGVRLYLSDFSRSLVDRMSKGDFFSDPGAAGLTCVRTGPVKVAPDLNPKKEGEDVFTESRSLIFKTLKVKRVYDKEGKAIVYVVFTERVDTGNDSNKSRFKSQLCAVPIDG